MIYILEDDRGWENYYRRILKGHEMEFFHDGVTAIAAMDERVPDLVILDVLLTGPTGFAVLNEMRSYPELAEVPVVVISSVSMKDEIAKEYGVARVFDKGELMPADVIAAAKEFDGKESA
ncbi:response regulator [Candidatus Saccharibacteria bacterium]|nr:response regulator [Candidatus Saccharibacteria bacterium]